MSNAKKCYCSAAFNNAGVCPFGCTPKTRCPGRQARAVAKAVRKQEKKARVGSRVAISAEERERAGKLIAELDPIYGYLRQKSLRRHNKK